MSRNLLAFATAALFEIAGCFTFWMWLRRGASPFVVLLGVASLVAFAASLTRVGSAFAGRASRLAAGIYYVGRMEAIEMVRDSLPAPRHLLLEGVDQRGTCSRREGRRCVNGLRAGLHGERTENLTCGGLDALQRLPQRVGIARV